MKNFNNVELVELNFIEMVSIDGGADKPRYTNFACYVHAAIDTICDFFGID